MKKRDLEKILIRNGYRKIDSNKHEKWTNGSQTLVIPHKHGQEINEYTAKAIIKRWGLK